MRKPFENPRFAPRTDTRVRPAPRTGRSPSAARSRCSPDRQTSRRRAPLREEAFSWSRSLFLHQPFGAHVLQIHSDRVNDLLVQMRLAVFNDEMLELSALLVVHLILVSEAVVPAAVPGHERIRVFLIG